MACEQNLFDLVPVSPSAPAPTDYVIFTLLDGTSVLRAWSTVVGSATPPDEEHLVAASGGDINNADTFFIRPAFIGARVRLYRNGTKLGTINNGGYYYSFTAGTGRFDIVPAAQTGEIFQIEAY
jgi:hypothetical protein